MSIADASFFAILLYLSIIEGALLWSLSRGAGHKFSWWDGGNLLKGKQFSVRETVLLVVLNAILLGVGGYFWYTGLSQR